MKKRVPVIFNRQIIIFKMKLSRFLLIKSLVAAVSHADTNYQEKNVEQVMQRPNFLIFHPPSVKLPLDAPVKHHIQKDVPDSTSNKRGKTIVIVGGGTAGIGVAAMLRNAGFTNITVVEPSWYHYYQPLWTLGKIKVL